MVDNYLPLKEKDIKLEREGFISENKRTIQSGKI